MVPVGSRVLARPGRGPSAIRWEPGEVIAHLGRIHRVDTPAGVFWCEVDDILPASPQRDDLLAEGARVWARWIDGRWFPGTVDAEEGPLRHVTWDDGDSMWIEASHAVLLAVARAPLAAGNLVAAPRWDGEYQAGILEAEEGDGFRVRFFDGEDTVVPAAEIRPFPPNPFRETAPPPDEG